MTEDDNSIEYQYIEDPYFNPISSTTPSLDECVEDLLICDSDISPDELLDAELELFDLKSELSELKYDSLNIDHISSENDESVNVETEFYVVKRANDILKKWFKNRPKKLVRVRYSDLTKPYLAKLPKDQFRKYLGIMASNEEAHAVTDFVPDDISNLSVDEQEKQREAWRAKLAQVEDEIVTLRTVLASKMRESSQLKRNLGITVWKEVSEDINQGIKNVKESQVFQSVENKVGQVTKAVTDAPIYQRTSNIIGGITGGITSKLGQMRHSESFKSIEEKVGTAYESVKTKVSSRSNSMQSLNEQTNSRAGSVVTSPTIDEEKPIA